MNKKRLFGEYTLLFALTALLVFVWYIITGRTFVWHVDGMLQYQNALIFYGEHLRTVLKTVFIEHSLNVPSFSFSLGEGGDILTTLQFYAIGAPLNLLTVFFTADNMYIFYNIVVVLRLYLAGLTFIYLCLTIGISKRSSILTGAIAYIFSYYAIFSAARHIVFLIPMLFLPLVIAGSEKVIRKERPNVLIISVFLSAVSNFYFFYMIVIMTVIYVAVRLICSYRKDLKKYIAPLKDMLIYSLAGVIAAGVVLVPVLYSFLTDTRLSSINRLRLIYPMDYYTDLPVMLLTPYNNYWLCLSLTPAAIFALLYLFVRKGSPVALKVLNIITIIFCLIPFFGQMFNGMTYMTNRWSFGAALMFSFTLSYLMEKLGTDRAFFKKAALICTAVIAVLCVATGNILRTGIIAQLVLLAIFALAFAFVPDKYLNDKRRPAFFLILTVISVTASSFILNMAAEVPYVAESRRPSEIAEHLNDDGLAAQTLLAEQDSFYRYSGADLHLNTASIRNVSTPGYYWSISNPDCIRFNTELGLTNYMLHKFQNFDDRTIMTDLSSVLYYIVPDDYEVIPYGYSRTDSSIYPGHTIYINDNPLGLTYSYDRTISESEWLEMSPAAKEEVMLYAAVVPDDAGIALSSAVPALGSVSVPFEIEENYNGFTLNIAGLSNSETRINLEGLRYEGGIETEIVAGASNGTIRIVEHYEDGYDYYNGKSDYTINLGYSEEPIDTIIVAYVIEGDYDLTGISVECIPMDNTSSALEALSEDTLQNVVMGTDTISGDIDLNEEKLLVFTIPFSEGWTASVDGQEYPIIKTDIKYIGLDLTPGHHTIELTYKTPYFGLGLVSSAVGFGLWIALYVINRKKEAHNVK